MIYWWVEEYMSDFMKDHDVSITLGYDSRMNYLEEKENNTVQATKKHSNLIYAIMFLNV